MHTSVEAALFPLAFFLGLRHGIDWDHIAAITDIVGTTKNSRQGILFALLYIVGHTLVILTLGLLAIFINFNLPPSLDSFMEKVVGITLIILGVFLIVSMMKQGRDYQMKSRWMVLFMLASKVYHVVTHRLHIGHRHGEYTPLQYPTQYGMKTSFFVGAVHGIGAETPTQVLLFVSASGVGNGSIGGLLLVAFVLGLVLSNTFISLVSILGYVKAKQNSLVFMVIGLLTAIFSLIVGTLFLLTL